MEALLVSEKLADQVWKARYGEDINDRLVARTWIAVARMDVA